MFLLLGQIGNDAVWSRRRRRQFNFVCVHKGFEQKTEVKFLGEVRWIVSTTTRRQVVSDDLPMMLLFLKLTCNGPYARTV